MTDHRTTNGIPFEPIPWHEDLQAIARLFRWLTLLGRAPEDVAYFIENAIEWEPDYRCMEAARANQTPRVSLHLVEGRP